MTNFRVENDGTLYDDRGPGGTWQRRAKFPTRAQAEIYVKFWHASMEAHAQQIEKLLWDCLTTDFGVKTRPT